MEEVFGKTVDHGFQFYAGSRERVKVEFSDSLRQQTREAITRCRELAVLDTPPEPLPSELRHPLLRLLTRTGLPAGGDPFRDRPPRTRNRQPPCPRHHSRHPAI
jgi:hypothetical protein